MTRRSQLSAVVVVVLTAVTVIGVLSGWGTNVEVVIALACILAFTGLIIDDTSLRGAPERAVASSVRVTCAVAISAFAIVAVRDRMGGRGRRGIESRWEPGSAGACWPAWC